MRTVTMLAGYAGAERTRTLENGWEWGYLVTRHANMLCTLIMPLRNTFKINRIRVVESRNQNSAR